MTKEDMMILREMREVFQGYLLGDQRKNNNYGDHGCIPRNYIRNQKFVEVLKKVEDCFRRIHG